jgi:LmbE family N-acetylglucosaminyl deacetylase
LKCLVIVAHPDDETIWMGGLMLRHPDWAWRIISLSRGDDPDRAPKFRMAVRVYGATSAISDLDDSPILASLSQDLHEIKDRIRETSSKFQIPSSKTQIPDSKFQVRNPTPGTRHPTPETGNLYDMVFTHGAHGEYERHLRHEQVHRVVKEMLADGELHGDLVYFAYADSNTAPDAEIIITLHPEEYASKQRVIREIYGFADGQFETQSAGRVEAFRFESRNLSQLKAILESDGRTK